MQIAHKTVPVTSASPDMGVLVEKTMRGGRTPASPGDRQQLARQDPHVAPTTWT
jgi:hypothetical protein